MRFYFDKGLLKEFDGSNLLGLLYSGTNPSRASGNELCPFNVEGHTIKKKEKIFFKCFYASRVIRKRISDRRKTSIKIMNNNCRETTVETFEPYIHDGNVTTIIVLPRA